MTIPAAQGAASQRATSPGTERQEEFLSPRIVAREASKVLAARGTEVRPATLRRLVNQFIKLGHTTLAEVEPFVLWYADPTGETAVRNVERGSRSSAKQREPR